MNEFLQELENLISKLKQILMGVVSAGLEPPVGIAKYIGAGLTGNINRKSSLNVLNMHR